MGRYFAREFRNGKIHFKCQYDENTQEGLNMHLAVCFCPACCLPKPVRWSNPIKLCIVCSGVVPWCSGAAAFCYLWWKYAAVLQEGLWASCHHMKHRRRWRLGISEALLCAVCAQEPCLCLLLVLTLGCTLRCWHTDAPTNRAFGEKQEFQHLGESKWTVLLKIQQSAAVLPERCCDAVVGCHIFWPL